MYVHTPFCHPVESCGKTGLGLKRKCCCCYVNYLQSVMAANRQCAIQYRNQIHSFVLTLWFLTLFSCSLGNAA